MQLRRSVLIFALGVVTAIVATKLIDARSHQLRFDGVYIAEDQRDFCGDLYLRFYPDGTVMSHAGGYGSFAEEAMETYRMSPWVKHGHYTADQGAVSIALEGYERIELPSYIARPDTFRSDPPRRQTYYLFGEVCFDRIRITSTYGHGDYKFFKTRLPNET
jgi:hypothetical protein